MYVYKYVFLCIYVCRVGKASALVCDVQWETREAKPVHLAPTPVRIAPPVHIGWDAWPERIYCIATRVVATEDAWAHAVERVPLGVEGAISTWIPLGETVLPWELASLGNKMEGKSFRTADKPLMLALLALEATTKALLHEGPSTIYVSDRVLAEKLDNRQVKWGSVKDPATRVPRKVYRMAAARIR